MKPIKILLLLLILGSLFSCSPQKRLNRLLKKHPELLTSQKDTIYIEGVETDTVFYYNQKDTVVIKEGRLTMKYFYNNNDSTVFLRGECAPDTLIREVKVPKFVEYQRTWYDKASLPIAILFLILLLLYILKKFFLK